MNNSLKLVIRHISPDYFECREKDRTEDLIIGCGRSVAEAIGEFVLESQFVEIMFNPPPVINKLSMKRDYSDLSFSKPPSRGGSTTKYIDEEKLKRAEKRLRKIEIQPEHSWPYK